MLKRKAETFVGLRNLSTSFRKLGQSSLWCLRFKHSYSKHFFTVAKPTTLKLNFNKFSSKSFTTNGELIEVQMSLNDALILNEVERTLLLLKSNNIEKSVMAPTMKTLANNSLALLDYRGGVKSWAKIYEYFYLNLDNLLIDDFLFYLKTLALSGQRATNQDEFYKIFDSLLKKEYTEDQFFDLLSFIKMMIPENDSFDYNHFYTKTMSEIKDVFFDFKNENKFGILLTLMSNKFTMPKDFWDLLSKLKGEDFASCSDNTVMSTVKICKNIKSNVNTPIEGEDFFKTFKEHVLNNIQEFSKFSLTFLFPLFVLTKAIDLSDMVKICFLTGSAYTKEIPTILKFDFTIALLEANYQQPKLAENLDAKHVIMSKVLTSNDVVAKFNEKREKLQTTGNWHDDYTKIREIVLQLSESLGFNKRFLTTYDTHTYYAFEEFNKFKKVCGKK